MVQKLSEILCSCSTILCFEIWKQSTFLWNDNRCWNGTIFNEKIINISDMGTLSRIPSPNDQTPPTPSLSRNICYKGGNHKAYILTPSRFSPSRLLYYAYIWNNKSYKTSDAEPSCEVWGTHSVPHSRHATQSSCLTVVMPLSRHAFQSSCISVVMPRSHNASQSLFQI